MDLKNTLDKINDNRSQIEACFVMCLWKDLSRYDDYRTVNTGKDKTLQNEDACFYFSIGRSIRELGHQSIDNVTIANFLQGKPFITERFEEMGGWRTCQDMLALVSPENTEAYFDQIAKMNTLSIMCKKYDELFTDVGRFNKATNEDVYNTFELLNNSVSLTTGHSSKIEDLTVDESYIQECNAGMDVGLNYGKGLPLLNYLTCGIPVGDMYLLAGHSGVGKSSAIFETMVIPLSEQGIKVAIISNEMVSKAYKNLLLIHVLTRDLNYWKITRKKLKLGHFSDDELEMLRKAAEIIKIKYNNIQFIKMFENESSKVCQYIKRLARTGTKAIVYDTMKADDSSTTDGQMWQALLQNSRKIFNVVSKEQVACVCTFQLALHSTNQRWLDATCLSNSKQIKEVVSELVMCRKLWQDEYTGQKYDCKPWHRNKDNPKIKEYITLDKDKTYVVFFLNKTRNDEDGQTIIAEFNGAWNNWRELGYCTIVNDHKAGS